MTQRIYKYPLALSASLQLVRMTPRAPILHVDLQSYPTIWAVHDDELEDVSRQFVIRGTGDEVPSRSEYLGTLMHHPWVWHVFELLG